jgi:hypothetical protein
MPLFSEYPVRSECQPMHSGTNAIVRRAEMPVSHVPTTLEFTEQVAERLCRLLSLQGGFAQAGRLRRRAEPGIAPGLRAPDREVEGAAFCVCRTDVTRPPTIFRWAP